jgi:hypothetical protein
MSKPIRILTAILASLAIGGMFAYQDAQKNAPTYQQHPMTVVLTDFFCGFLSGLIFYFGSGWLAKRKERKLGKAGDVKFYEEVARELQEKPMVSGLWTKAFAEMGGDDAKARALYIKYRVAQLAAKANQEQSIKQSQVSEAKKRQTMAAFRGRFNGILGSIFIILSAGCIVVVAIVDDSFVRAICILLGILFALTAIYFLDK